MAGNSGIRFLITFCNIISLDTHHRPSDISLHVEWLPLWCRTTMGGICVAPLSNCHSLYQIIRKPITEGGKGDRQVTCWMMADSVKSMQLRLEGVYISSRPELYSKCCHNLTLFKLDRAGFRILFDGSHNLFKIFCKWRLMDIPNGQYPARPY